MSKTASSKGGSSEESYSPFERIELTRGNGLIADLFFLLVVLGGLSFQGGLLSVAAWFVLHACWANVRVEFTFGVGAVLFAGLTGSLSRLADAVAVAVGSGLDIQLVAAIITLAGLGGLLANDLKQTWQSIRLVTVFVVLVGFSAVLLALTSQAIGIQRLGAGTIVVLVSTSYVLHRYERGQRWRGRQDRGDTETDGPRSEDS
jgi:hypothetical protein